MAVLILLLKNNIQWNLTLRHLTSKKTSQLQSPWLSPKLYSAVQITPCNKVTSPLRSLLPNPVGDLNSEVRLYLVDTVLIQETKIQKVKSPLC